MSEEVKTEKQEVSNEEQQETTDSVGYATYRKTLDQAKTAREQLKAAQEQLNALKAEKEAAEQAKLEEQGKFKELAEKKDQELKQLLEEREKERQAALKHHKLLAFKENVGDLANPRYADLIDFDKITVTEDGQIDKDSLKEYGSAFRETHAGLFKQAPKQQTPNAQAPQDFSKPAPQVTAKNAQAARDELFKKLKKG